MDSSELAETIPATMACFPAIAWRSRVEGSRTGDLAVDLHVRADASRTARLRVLNGAEVFVLSLAGHESADFAYDDAERREVLAERLQLACLALHGPTRITLTRRGRNVVRSELVIDPEGPAPRHDGPADWPLRGLAGRLLRRAPRTETVELPPL